VTLPSGGSRVRPLHEAERRWVFRGAKTADEADRAAADASAMSAALNLPLPVCRLLALRGHADSDAARHFLKPALGDLHDPLLLAGADAAVDRIARAIRHGEGILVHGDYDVDGICSTALLTRVLRALGAEVVPFVPHRMSDGYDLGHAGIRRAVEAGAGLIVTADCGTVAHDAVAEAAAAGIDVVVTDHHHPGATLPAAVAVLNPNRSDCAFPYKGLAGAGVAFKLCEALVSALGGDRDALLWHLDLVAVATIADLAPLTGENRILAHYGMRVLRQTRNPGLAALMHVAGISPDRPLAGGQISHALAPRLNAAGRMGAASRGVDLLLADDHAIAVPLAQEMETENRLRQSVDRRILDDALRMLGDNFDPDEHYGVVLSSPEWHAGVIGIVASRVVEQIHRPVLLIAEDPETGRGRGSGRSIPRFNLYEGVHACSDLLERYGGHRQAAGLEVRLDRIDSLRTAFNVHARSVLSPDDLIADVAVDVEIALGEATSELCRILRRCGPFGMGNPQPVFVVRGARCQGSPRQVGSGQHLQFMLSADGVQLPAIAFRMAERLRSVDFASVPFDVAFQLHEDHWNGRDRLQARIVDLRPVP
jgi:single-stranded-DNA-specific exonuclease